MSFPVYLRIGPLSLHPHQVFETLAWLTGFAVKKTCVHNVHPDGRLTPFDTCNLFYRDDPETSRLAPVRARFKQGRDANV